MRLPDELRDAIDAELADIDTVSLVRSARQLSERYRRGEFASAPLKTAADRAAYFAVRMPATFAATSYVFSQAAVRLNTPVHSLLDLGAGPGTAAWAAARTFPLETITLVERDPGLVATGRRLASHGTHSSLSEAAWVHADLRSLPTLELHDLVLFSYSAGELRDISQCLNTAWNLARVALIVIEPGTTRGFATILRARQMLIDAGAQLAAPCPHHLQCPLAAADDWCHFAVRLERTSRHRRLKGAELGYEDEKFSYIVGARTAVKQADTRIVRHPLKHPGHVQMLLCTPTGLVRRTLTKSNKEAYRRSRKAEWGDEWTES